MMNKLMGNSSMPNYVKLTATGILALTYLACLVIAMRDYLLNVPIPNDITFVIGSGLTYAITVIGLHTGQAAGENMNNASPPTT